MLFFMAAVGQGRWGLKLLPILLNLVIQQKGLILPTNCSHQSNWEHFSIEEFFSMFILFFKFSVKAYLDHSRLNVLLKYHSF